MVKCKVKPRKLTFDDLMRTPLTRAMKKREYETFLQVVIGKEVDSEEYYKQYYSSLYKSAEFDHTTKSESIMNTLTTVLGVVAIGAGLTVISGGLFGFAVPGYIATAGQVAGGILTAKDIGHLMVLGVVAIGAGLTVISGGLFGFAVPGYIATAGQVAGGILTAKDIGHLITGRDINGNPLSETDKEALMGSLILDATMIGVNSFHKLKLKYVHKVNKIDSIKGLIETDDILIQRYGTLKKNKDIQGQSHHLNQDAAFRDVIPREEGLAIKLEGNIFTDIGSPHYNVHKSMEEFWSQYRKGGGLYGSQPKIVEYNKALYEALQSTGLSKKQCIQAMREAVKQQLDYGLSSTMNVPRIPEKINLK